MPKFFENPINDFLRKREILRQAKTIGIDLSQRNPQLITSFDSVEINISRDMQNLGNVTKLPRSSENKLLMKLSPDVFKEKPNVIPHEIGHVLQHLNHPSLNDNYEDDPYTLVDYKTKIPYSGINEAIAFITEFIYSPDKNSYKDYKKDSKTYMEQFPERYPNSKYPSLYFFYRNPSHALGMCFAEKIIGENQNIDQLKNFLANFVFASVPDQFDIVKASMGTDYDQIISRVLQIAENQWEHIYGSKDIRKSQRKNT